MSDFALSPYAPYRALCRELKLERRWQEGDWFEGWEGDAYRIFPVGPYGGLGRSGSAGNPQREVWLPSLADWLEMLEEAGYPHIVIQAIDQGSHWCANTRVVGACDPDLDAHGFTREEAVARLWVALDAQADRS